MYYLNNPCTVIGEIDGETLVEVENSEGEAARFFVNKKHLSKNKINFEAETLKEIAERRAQIEKIESEHRLEILKEKSQAEKEIKEIKERAKKITGMEKFISLCEGVPMWALTLRYRKINLIESKDLPKCNVDSHNDSALVFIRKREWSRSNPTTSFRTYLNDYSDGSGSERYAMELFYSKEEAVSRAIELMDSDKYPYEDNIKFCEENGVTGEKVNKAKAFLKERTDKIKAETILRLEKELERERNG